MATGHSTKSKGSLPAVVLPTAGRRRGRPPDFKPEYVAIARNLCYLDSKCTNPQLAAFFGVAVSTLSKWLVDHPAFSDAIAQAKLTADTNVAFAAYQSSLGGTKKKQVAVKTKVNGVEKIKIVELIEDVEPNVSAQQFWLTNRRPDLWKRMPEESIGDETAPVAKVQIEVQHSPHASKAKKLNGGEAS